METTLKDRLSEALAASGKTKIELARFCGISHPSVSNWFNGRTKELSSINALKAAQFLGVSVTWLTTGLGNPHSSTIIPAASGALAEGLVSIPEYEVRCGAGSSYAPSFEEATEAKPSFYRKEWFTEHGVSPQFCRRLKVHGDSMVPILYDKDTILCDCSPRPIVSGKIYAFCYGDEVRVKRLYTKLDGGILVRSENTALTDEEIPASDIDRFYLIGRVIDRSRSGPF